MPPTARTSRPATLTGRVALLDASTGSAVGSPVQLPGPVTGVTLAPDGRTAFVVTRTDPIPPGAIPTFDGWALLDLETGSVIRTGRLPETGVAVGRLLPRRWPGGRGLRLRTGVDRRHRAPGDPWTLLLRCTRSAIYWLGWSPDGSRILSNDGGGTLELWDAATGTVQDTVTLPTGTAAWASSDRARRT